MVVTNPGPNASTEMNISWHTTNAFAAIQYTKATDPNFQSLPQNSAFVQPFLLVEKKTRNNVKPL